MLTEEVPTDSEVMAAIDGQSIPYVSGVPRGCAGPVSQGFPGNVKRDVRG